MNAELFHRSNLENKQNKNLWPQPCVGRMDSNARVHKAAANVVSCAGAHGVVAHV